MQVSATKVSELVSGLVSAESVVAGGMVALHGYTHGYTHGV